MLHIPIDKESSLPLFRQVTEGLRQLILTGALPPDFKLPSSRKLALELGVSRNLVTNVYEQLEAEGYLVPRRGSGTFVASGSVLNHFNRDKSGSRSLQRKSSEKNRTDTIFFRTAVPVNHFPRSKWAETLRDAALYSPDEDWEYGQREGLASLRNELKTYLHRAKGIQCRPDQIFIVDGTSQALIICSQVLCLQTGTIVVEDPLLDHVTGTLKSRCTNLVPIPVDEQGLRTDLLLGQNYDAVHVTPSHHHPLGYCMPVQRRIHLVESVRNRDAIILENDYDSEFFFSHSPLSSLQLLAPDIVVHIGTFSGTMYPAIRLGYLVVPETLVDDFKTRMTESGYYTSMIKQAAMALFLERGYYERHVLQLKKIYRKKHDILRQALNQYIREPYDLPGIMCGQYQAVRFPCLDFHSDFDTILKKEGVYCERASQHSGNPETHRDTLVLSFGALSDNEIREGIKRLASAVARYTSH